MGDDIGIGLHLRNELLQGGDQIVEKLLLQREDFLLRTQDFLLVFFQLLGNITLRLGESLLTHPLSRNLVLIGVTYFQIIPKDIIITYLQRGDTRCRRLTLLNLQQVVFTRISNMTEVVKLGIHTITDDTTLCHLLRWVVSNLPLNTVTDLLTKTQPLPYPAQRLVIGMEACCLDRLYRL